MMVKNEDIYIRKAIENIKEFCDEIIVIDTGSTDNTIAEIEKTGLKAHVELDLKNTHRFIEPYIGTDTWIFGVDGDELYDPAGLERLKWQIEYGMYDGCYQVQGWYLHAWRIIGNQIIGFLGPPSHTPTKLYNMKNITTWQQDGKHILFLCRPMGMVGSKGRAYYDNWDETPLRCVHMRFQHRSSIESEDTIGARLHGEDILGYGNRGDRGGTDKRNERLVYRKGDQVTKVIK